jgi:predicted transglutaminase-like cysteine proteinase
MAYSLRIALSVAASLVALASPAAAQSFAPANVAGFSKTEAILGGAPSRLAAILAVQSGAAAASLATASAPPLARAILQPAVLVPEAEPVSADRPDVFGSVALEVGRTPLDHRWARVAHQALGGRDAAFAASLRSGEARRRIEAVNLYVNARVDFVDDTVQYHVPDRWSAASETLRRGRGDCEDYALAKMALLRRAGFAAGDLYLVVLKDLVRRADHAVLVVRSEGRFLVLDNGTDRVVDSAEVRDYRPVLTFTDGKTFTHGYRREAVEPPVVMASAVLPPLYATASLNR